MARNRPGNPGPTETVHGTNQIPVVKASLVGFATGVAASASYVALGGAVWLDVPPWATILFYPGFVAGFAFGVHVPAPIMVPTTIGCLTVGAEYAVLAVMLFLIGRGVSRNRRRTRMREP